MKDKLFAILFVITVAIGFTSCSSDDTTDVGAFTVNIDGQLFVATTLSAVKDDTGHIFIIGKRDTDGKSVALSIHNVSTGTFTDADMTYFDADNDVIEYLNNEPGPAPLNGVVNVTSMQDNKISGSFSFTGYTLVPGEEPKQFTNGMFENIPITASQPPDGYIVAKIDGVQTAFGGINILYSGNNVVLSSTNMQTMNSVQIVLPENIEPGTYPLGNNIAAGCTITIGEPGSSVTSSQGSVTIYINDSTGLSGSFYFTGLDGEGNSYQVTEGAFSTPLN